ncbi:MAG: WbqC family protein [Rikenellaceae bacterium]
MALFSTQYFGNILYFATALNSGELLIEAHENYIKQSYRNRCSILSANGKIDLTVPTEKISGSKIAIKEVKIDYTTRWQQMHERAIVASYKNSPFFEHYFDYIEPLFRKKPQFLFDMNMEILELIEKMLCVKLNIAITNNFIPLEERSDDYRFLISPKKSVEEVVFSPYYQVFSHKMEFVENMSIIDLLFCEGNESISYLKSLNLFKILNTK